MGNNPETNRHYSPEFRPIEVLDRAFRPDYKALAFRPDDASLDAFGRQRVSNPTTIWDSQFEYNLHPLYYATVLANNGTVTHNAPHSSADLNVTTDNGSRSVIQTYEYFRYQPGKSQRVEQTFIPAPTTTGLIQRIGQFDDENGFFFEVNGASAQFVRRSKVTGSVVDHVIPQTQWSEDKFDGRGLSRQTLDLSLLQLLNIDYQWLSAGIIRFGFYINGNLHYAHFEKISNLIGEPSTVTANLPIRWELTTSQAIAGNRNMEGICVSLVSEGGQELQTGHPFEFGREGATAADNTEEAFIGIRPATTFNSIVYRGKIVPLRISLLVSGADCHWRLRYSPTTLTGVSWQAPVTHSGVQTDIATTAIAGGIIIDGGFIAAGQGNRFGEGKGEILQRLPLTLQPDGTQTQSLFLTIEGLGGATTVHGSMNWEEIR